MNLLEVFLEKTSAIIAPVRKMAARGSRTWSSKIPSHSFSIAKQMFMVRGTRWPRKSNRSEVDVHGGLDNANSKSSVIFKKS